MCLLASREIESIFHKEDSIILCVFHNVFKECQNRRPTLLCSLISATLISPTSLSRFSRHVQLYFTSFLILSLRLLFRVLRCCAMRFAPLVLFARFIACFSFSRHVALLALTRFNLPRRTIYFSVFHTRFPSPCSAAFVIATCAITCQRRFAISWFLRPSYYGLRLGNATNKLPSYPSSNYFHNHKRQFCNPHPSISGFVMR